MEQTQLINILSDHADALNDGVNETEAILAAHPAARATLAPLLGLARHIKASLAPVKPPPQFVFELGLALQAGEPVPLSVSAPTPVARRAMPVAAALGSLVSVIGLLLLWRRWQRDEAALPA